MTVVVRFGPVSARPGVRSLVVSSVLVVLAVLVGFVSLSRGAGWDPPSEVLGAFVGGGGSPVVVLQWRLPRVVAALVFGAGLGVSGAVFQNLTRNPLGSPDVIGLDAGAHTGALIVLTTLGGSALSLAGAALLGGLLAASVVLALAAGRSSGAGLRLVVVGVAVNAMLVALNSWIILRADLEVALAGAGWNAGSLNGVGWEDVGPALGVVVAVAVALVLLAPAIAQHDLGDGLAAGTGVELVRLRRLLVVVGAAASAVVTAVAGPILFVALAAPQIGRRLAGAAGTPLVPAAATGAVLLTTADLVARLAPAGRAVPVGVVTVVLGGLYLMALLAREVRTRW
ncbi:iron chelate uptake ABC transporter family permease subunit [Actinomycetospora sp. OC33-EN08]|uniref:Iron chelate uptake ABC transporter family permease subunit n=1 Tax=Actinomycetospora aurantiaca TaxID=3129233 RepID=A0ABU8MWI0_9PSEU